MPHDLSIPGCETCIVCGNMTLVSGEYTDVGVGYVQTTPEFCEWCGYVQPSLYQENRFTFDQLTKLWELQIDPWSREESYDVV